MTNEIYITQFCKLTVCVCACALKHVQLFVAPQTVAHQSPLSIGFSRQEYWSGLPCSPLGHLSSPEIKPKSPVSPALAGGFFTTRATWEAQHEFMLGINSVFFHLE